MGLSLDAQDRWSTAPRIYWLWAGVLLPPVAWALHLNIAYAMSAAVCSPPVRWPFFLVSAIALGPALGGGWISWRLRRDTADEPEDAPTSRARGRFMALSGVLLSVIFSLSILAQTIPVLVLEPCPY